MRNFDGLNNKDRQYHQYNSYTNSILPNQTIRRVKKKRKWKWFFLILLLLAGIAFVFGGSLVNKANKIFTNKQNIFTRVGKLFVSEDKPLIGEEQGRVNILLLGMGGPGHEGPLLTDTMIVASFDVNTKEVVLTSIPRDFMVKYSGRGYNKINAAYAFGEQKEENSGGQSAIDAVEQITGLEIPYFAAIDFKGFVKAVNNVGGVDVVVERTFTDSTYPDYNNGYLAPQTFTKGPAHLDGEKALVFARSRHGNNGEGSDFARSDRQKKVMLAMKEKLQNLNLTNVSTLNKLLSDFTENFRTNMEPYELIRLAKLAPDISDNTVYSLNLDPQAGIICDGMYDLATGKPAPAPQPVVTPDDSTDSATSSTTKDTASTGTTTTPKTTTPKTTTPSPTPTQTPSPTPTPAATPETPTIVRAYVIVPCYGKTITDVHAFLAASMQTASLQKEAVVIEIQNSTGKTAALNKLKNLSLSDIETKNVAFKGKTVYEKTIVYDNTNGAKPNSLKYILDNYGFAKADVNYPQSTADIVIILGNDALQ